MLQLLSERGVLDRLAFKGGTCLRKMFVGSQGRFSTDLDFTGLEEHDHEDVILEMMQAFGQPFQGTQFAIPDENYYETQDGLSWGVNPTYVHEWNAGRSEIRLQISCRETPTLPTERRPQIVVLKLWQARDSFDPARLMKKFQDGRDFDWHDLGQLLRRTAVIDRDRITVDCARGFAFLTDLTDEERALANDQHQRERALWERLGTTIVPN